MTQLQRRPALAALLAAAVVWTGCGSDEPGSDEPGSGDGAQPGDVAAVPSLQAVTLDGDSVALAGLRGEVVLLNVWATWCVPCRKEAPELEALHQAHRDSGLHVVGVTVDNRSAEDQIRRFIEQHGMTYEIWWDPDGDVIDEFGAAGVPLTVLIDRHGGVVWRHLGAFTADDPSLRQALRETLEI